MLRSSHLIILGNGPSLKDYDFPNYKSCDTLGMNAAYRYWDKINWYPNHYICLDDQVIDTHASEILRLIKDGIIKSFFLSSVILERYPEIKEYPNVFFLQSFVTKWEVLAIEQGLPVIESDYFISEKPNFITTGGHAIRFAAFLGYKSISVLGVDLTYQPLSGGVVNTGGTKLILDKTPEQNPNYFFDDYQQKGDKFHAPNPVEFEDLHTDVFRILAKDILAQFWNVDVVNSNINSVLQEQGILPYKEIVSFISEASCEDENLFVKESFSPKVLVIDSTPIGHQSATGQIKSVFFSKFDENRIFQVWMNSSIPPTFHTFRMNQNISESKSVSISKEDIINSCKEFAPDVIYFRPIDSLEFLDLALEITSILKKPLVLHVMDDWLTRQRTTNYGLYYEINTRFKKLVNVANVCLSISEAMSQAYTMRYGKTWYPIANGVDVNSSKSKSVIHEQHQPKDAYVIKYMGGVADDMNYQSVLDVATAVSDIDKSENIIFEIYTMPWYQDKIKNTVKGFKNVVIKDLVDYQYYEDCLLAADSLLLCYNFDSTSIGYTALSLANKMPECLATGIPLIAYGPKEVETINVLQNNGLAHVTSERDIGEIKKSILFVKNNPEYCTSISLRAINFVYENQNKVTVSDRFQFYIAKAIFATNSEKTNFLVDELELFYNYILKSEITLRTANKCISEGFYLKALVIYSRLYLTGDYSYLAFNIKLCLKRIRFNEVDFHKALTSFV